MVNTTFTKVPLNQPMSRAFRAVLRRPGGGLASAALAAAFVLLAPASTWPSSFAQAPEPRSDPAAAKATREQELEKLQLERKKADESATRLKAEIAAFGEDRRKLNQALISSAARMREIEARMSETEGRIHALQADEKRVRQSLDGRRAETAEVLAALQRMGRRPPPALLVRPEDALESIRTAILLGAILPDMRKDIDALAANLNELVRLRQQMATERDALSRDLADADHERQRLSLLEIERQRKQADMEKALDAERANAAQLARQAGDLKELIAKLEKDIAAAARAAEAAARADRTPGEPRTNAAALKDSGRLAPAMAFAVAKGSLPLPVNGVRLREYGDADGLGGSQRGLSIATRAGAQVTAPCDGWVVYAGPFRSYGQLLILNAGGGYHVLLAGMDRISVDLGQFVLTGEPVAVMGGGPQVAAAVAIGSSQPVLYVEFRKDGVPVDPSPWWATKDSEKVRG